MTKTSVNTGFSRIVAFDPGGTTGIAVAQLSNVSGIYVVGLGFQVSQTRMSEWLKKHEDWWDSEDCALVVEDFTLRPNAGGGGRRTSGLSPVAIGQMIETHIDGRCGDIFWQSASLAKTTMTDARLKHRDMWIKGRPHTRDALRHLVTWDLRQGFSSKHVSMGSKAQMFLEF